MVVLDTDRLYVHKIVLNGTEELLSDSSNFSRIKFNPKIRLIKR